MPTTILSTPQQQHSSYANNCYLPANAPLSIEASRDESFSASRSALHSTPSLKRVLSNGRRSITLPYESDNHPTAPLELPLQTNPASDSATIVATISSPVRLSSIHCSASELPLYSPTPPPQPPPISAPGPHKQSSIRSLASRNSQSNLAAYEAAVPMQRPGSGKLEPDPSSSFVVPPQPGRVLNKQASTGSVASKSSQSNWPAYEMVHHVSADYQKDWKGGVVQQQQQGRVLSKQASTASVVSRSSQSNLLIADAGLLQQPPSPKKQKDPNHGANGGGTLSKAVSQFFKALFDKKAADESSQAAVANQPQLAEKLSSKSSQVNDLAHAPSWKSGDYASVLPTLQSGAELPPAASAVTTNTRKSIVSQGSSSTNKLTMQLKGSFKAIMAGLGSNASGPQSPPTPSSPSFKSGHSFTKVAPEPSPALRAAPERTSAPSMLLAASASLPPSMNRRWWLLEDYDIVEKIYTGYASTVYKAFCKHSGELVCIKTYSMANLCELNRYQVYREIRLHSKLQHENIITLYAAFRQGEHVVLVQEYAESGDLFMLLHKYGGKMPERKMVQMVLYPMLLVLHYMHQSCIVHRDVKPENVLFTRSMALKLCDFGLAIDLREERAVTRAGTLEYMAPEVLNCPFKNDPEENKNRPDYYYDSSVDTWAVGVLAYELLVGFPPFNDKQREAVEEKIRDESPRFPSNMSEFARNFILRALQKDAVERPSLQELLHHPFVQAHRSTPSMRNLAAALQQKPNTHSFRRSIDFPINSDGRDGNHKAHDMHGIGLGALTALLPSSRSALSFTAGMHQKQGRQGPQVAGSSFASSQAPWTLPSGQLKFGKKDSTHSSASSSFTQQGKAAQQPSARRSLAEAVE